MLVLNDEWFYDKVAIMSKNQSDIIPNEGLISLGTTQCMASLDALTIDSLLPNVGSRRSN